MINCKTCKNKDSIKIVTNATGDKIPDCLTEVMTDPDDSECCNYERVVK